MQLACETLKTEMTRAPVLALPNPTLPYIVTTDASDYAIGAKLSQVQNKIESLIAFDSRKLKTAKCNYPVHKQELLVVLYALQK